jgi:S1-C subfamily serine protease
MKKKHWFLVLFIYVSVISVANLAWNIYFLATTPPSASGIFNIAKDSVVEIMAETEDIGVSYGSGVVVNKDGTIVTNAHVITYKKLGQSYAFETISIRLIDEQDFREVDIVKYDLDLDIAVLKLTCDRNIQPIKIGNDSNLDYGDKVYAIGNMSNQGISLTIGYIAIPHINVTYNEITRNVIQCNLTISDGNSGGALIDENGKLVGITTFRLKDQSNNIIYGISYCIPINTVMEYIENN